MNKVDEYINKLNEQRKEKVSDVINYIRENYAELEESCDYAPKTKFPVFKDKNSNNYVAIASQKSYISIHFGTYSCTEIVAKADKRIKSGVGCSKITDTIEFPLREIKDAIDFCFNDLK